MRGIHFFQFSNNLRGIISSYPKHQGQLVIVGFDNRINNQLFFFFREGSTFCGSSQDYQIFHFIFDLKSDDFPQGFHIYRQIFFEWGDERNARSKKFFHISQVSAKAEVIFLKLLFSIRYGEIII